MIHLYFGSGKGKTTASVGLSVRHVGAGGRVLFSQFLKDGSSSELSVFRELDGITVVTGAALDGFYKDLSPEEKETVKADVLRGLDDITSLLKSGEFTMVVLDEFLCVIELGLIDKDTVLAFTDRCKGLELVMTGAPVSQWLLDLADYASEIAARNHPYEKGVIARKGIEY